MSVNVFSTLTMFIPDVVKPLLTTQPTNVYFTLR